ncbi:hypothetical protein [Actinophytocola oryzae]|nr:hypothetical protein [Actinophytocola oryzae]
MGTTRLGRNTKLAGLLDAAGWSRADTARRIRTRAQELGHTGIAVDASRVTRWISGERPRPPAGDILAALLSGHFDTEITLLDLDLAPPRASAPLPADHGLDLPWDAKGLHRLAEEWHVHMLSRRTFLTVSGAALTAPGWASFTTSAPVLAAAAHTDDRVTVDEPLLNVIDGVVANAQQLDEQHGAAGAEFVADQFHSVARLLRVGSYTPATGQRLAAALAQLAQTTGFMDYDALRDGRAQRWYLTGLHAAHAAHDRPLTASILALMSNQAITLGQITDALQLAPASQEAAAHAPAPVRALIAARASLAHAAAGDLTSFRHARDATLTHLDHLTAGEPAPRWAAYVSPTELDAITGRGLVTLATHLPHQQHTLLTEAEPLLRNRADTDATSVSQRSALRHGVLLALAHTRTGNLDQAAATTRAALNRLDTVASPRILQLLHQLRGHLADHAHRNAHLRGLVTDLETPFPPARAARGRTYR